MLLAPLALQATTKNPLGAEQHLVLFGSGSPCTQIASLGAQSSPRWEAELGAAPVLLSRVDRRLLRLEARAGHWLFQKKEEFSGGILERR